MQRPKIAKPVQKNPLIEGGGKEGKEAKTTLAGGRESGGKVEKLWDLHATKKSVERAVFFGLRKRRGLSIDGGIRNHVEKGILNDDSAEFKGNQNGQKKKGKESKWKTAQQTKKSPIKIEKSNEGEIHRFSK